MASLGVNIFSVLLLVGVISSGSGAEIPSSSFISGLDLPAGCAWEDKACQADTQDTIIPKSNVDKALCCPKGKISI